MVLLFSALQRDESTMKNAIDDAESIVD